MMHVSSFYAFDSALKYNSYILVVITKKLVTLILISHCEGRSYHYFQSVAIKIGPDSTSKIRRFWSSAKFIMSVHEISHLNYFTV